MSGRVGLVTSSAGVEDEQALTLDLATYVSHAHHKNFEAARAARCFSVCTGAAGVAPGTGLSTTPPLTLYNPLGSGVVLALVSAALGYISGTLGKGSLVLGANGNVSQAEPSGGTTLTPICTYHGFTGVRAAAYQGATLAAAPTLIEPLFILGAWVGSADTAFALRHLWEGTHLVAPGGSVSLQGIAAGGTSPLVLLSLTWEEVRL